MKTFSALLFLVFPCCLYGRIITVSNMVNSPGQYTGFIEVSGVVVPGDTILVHGSPISYGSTNIRQNDIVIIGTGHTPDKQFPYTTSFENIEVSGDNVQLIGVIANTIFISARNNFTMRRCKILDLGPGPGVEGSNRLSGNLLFESNVFTGGQPNIRLSAVYPTDMITIRNNVFSSYLDVTSFNPTATILITNNIFLGSSFAFLNINYATISNNIFYGSSPYTSVTATINYYNNISFQAANNTFTTGPNITLSNNLENIDPQFVNYPGGVRRIFQPARL